jgi:hypothetical protein
MNVNFIRVGDKIIGQLIDYWAAYRQYINRDDAYRLDVNITFSDVVVPDSTNIMVIGLMDHIDPADHPDVDLFLLDNNGESLEVSSDLFRELMLGRTDCWLVCGSYVQGDQTWQQRMISWNHNHTMTADAMTRAFYPQYHDVRISRHQRDRSMIYCNGQNRAWRQYWMHLMNQHCHIDVRNTLSTTAMPVLHCAWESTEDQLFREWLNGRPWVTELDQPYEWCNAVAIGIEQGGQPKFGHVLAGYTMLDLYYQYHCVIYPESSWINDQLFVTEKTFKCLVAGAIPWPISGAGTNRMLDTIGVRTAWHLLPQELRSWDQEQDHRARYRAQSEAVAWAAAHPDIWISAEADQIRAHNRAWFYCNSMNVQGAQCMDRAIMAHVSR